MYCFLFFEIHLTSAALFLEPLHTVHATPREIHWLAHRSSHDPLLVVPSSLNIVVERSGVESKLTVCKGP
jgi:hypothetical protein